MIWAGNCSPPGTVFGLPCQTFRSDRTVHVHDGAPVHIESATFTNQVAMDEGSVLLVDDGDVTLDEVAIRDNKAFDYDGVIVLDEGRLELWPTPGRPSTPSPSHRHRPRVERGVARPQGTGFDVGATEAA